MPNPFQGSAVQACSSRDGRLLGGFSSPHKPERRERRSSQNKRALSVATDPFHSPLHMNLTEKETTELIRRGRSQTKEFCIRGRSQPKELFSLWKGDKKYISVEHFRAFLEAWVEQRCGLIKWLTEDMSRCKFEYTLHGILKIN